ncbi:hypothetical protein ACOZ4L_06925 [Haloplanus ruber]|uniref:Uncharacterized protein n=1 Tax=Haloplanus ruber TaxID=869892 RepID=A0ABD6CUL2_9EURY|nr:hypothetical protein [Haloplanus ruber]
MADGDAGLHRRRLLGVLAGASVGSLAGCPAPDGDDSDADTPAPTTTPDPETARRLAERFAPTLAFDAAERWFPTDPRPYATERDGETVVDGFAALDGYTRAAAEADTPPDPTVFYHVVEYEASPLAVVQYWVYSAFDQFTTNFHWHDWEVLHVYVDTDADDPQLFVASSHSTRVPNNEFLDPPPDRVPRILSELGSHSSALSLNDRRDSFQRLPLDDLPADITNRAVGLVEQLAELPAAYGLPRDEGLRLPYLVPEVDGAPLYDHERLPAVDREALVDEALTVRSFDALSTPPSDLPARETALVFGPATGTTPDTDADVTYDLVSTTELEDIAAFTGPQLSFEFAVPEFAEDAVASHISTAGTPWRQDRYDDPAADITEPVHRAALADRYDAVDPPGPVNDVVATVTEVVRSADAPDGAGVTTTETALEAVALLRSDPVAAPTFRGVAMLRGVETGSHRLVVNGAGLAPHAEPVEVGGDGDTPADVTASDTPTPTATGTDGVGRTATLAGVGGEIPLVPRDEATKLEVDAEGADTELTALAVDDDFGGRLYEAPLADSDAVYVHRGGAYTTEVRDTDDAVGAFRVNPAVDDADPVRIDRPRTGKASLASFVATITEETAEQLASLGDERDSPGGGGGNGHGASAGETSTLGGLLRAMEAVSGAASRAAERAKGGDRGGADRALEALAANLQRVVERFDGLRETLPDPAAAAADRRFRQAQRRTEQAAAAEKL